MPKRKQSTSLPDLLRKSIMESDKTNYVIARETGIAQSVLSRFMTGERSITIDTADKLCQAVGLTVTRKLSKV